MLTMSWRCCRVLQLSLGKELILQTSVWGCLELEAFLSSDEMLCAVTGSMTTEQERAQGAGCAHAICILSSHRNPNSANLFSLRNVCNYSQIELLQMLIFALLVVC